MGLSVRDYSEYNGKISLQWVAPSPVQGLLGSLRIEKGG